MKRNTKHCLLHKIIAIASAAIVMISVSQVRAEAENIDAASEQVGYRVDLDVYKPVKWYTRSHFYTYYKDGKSNHEVGYTAIDWGVTRAKSTSDGKYLDIIMSRATMQGKGSNGVYGYSNRVVLSSFLNSGQTLFSVSPKNTPPSNSYTIGFSAGVGKDGLSGAFSGEKTITKGALKIFDETDVAANKPRIRYEYYRDTWAWQTTLSKYCFDRSEQLMAFSLRTNASKYLARIQVEAQFKLYDRKPDGVHKRLNNRNIYANSNRTVIFYTPY